MAAELFKLDTECHEDGLTKSIRVPIGADKTVCRLLEEVRERSKMNLTELFTVRDGLKSLLYPDDLLHLALDEGENRLAAEAEAKPGTGTVTAEPPQEPAGLSAKASAPPPSRSRSPSRRKPSETARLPKQPDRQRSSSAAVLLNGRARGHGVGDATSRLQHPDACLCRSVYAA